MEPNAAARTVPAMPKSPLAGLNVLLLEDDTLLRRRLTGFLESEKAEVTPVNTLAAARRALEDLPFEAALIDVNLLDGRGICCATRSSPPRPR